jgi:hypothetical protein
MAWSMKPGSQQQGQYSIPYIELGSGVAFSCQPGRELELELELELEVDELY